ncbi:MAG: hypothetical protein IPK63_18925 [Candidatus Competibacteraceae bacterium]|nr:hypothetical protein [Candidatus Competibacteraceae bacterium]
MSSNEMVIHQSAPLVPYQDMERMAAVIAQSGLFGVKNQNQAMALMLLAQAEGMHPATAARDYHVIQGKPALKADTMLARFQAAGGKVDWNEYTDTAVSGTFCHPSGGKVKIEWTFEMAKRANLAGKDLWKQYPRAMLRARVISEGIRTVYPGVLSGMYTPEEVRDFIELQGEAETSGPTTAPPPPPEEIARDYDGEIQAFTDKTALRTWLADQRKANNWKPDHPVYSTLKAACAERAQAIDADAKKLAEVQAADDFDAGLGPVEDLGEPA